MCSESDEEFRIGGVLVCAENRKVLPAAILVMAQLVASSVIPMDEADEDWFSARFWEGCDIVATALRKFDKVDPTSLMR